MPLILVIENEDRFIQRILDTLGTEGWETRQVASPEEGVQVGTSQTPDLVLINSELEGAEVIYSSFTRRHGGPGVVAMIPEHKAAEMDADRLGVDGMLVKPFTDQDLRLEVRRGLSGSAPPSLGSPAAAGQKLTSEDIFGDLVAELESEVTQEPAPAPASQAASPKPPPVSPKPPAAAPAPPPAAASSDIEKKLEQTLSGVLDLGARKPPAPSPPKKPKPKPKADTDIDSLLSNTLSGLEKTAPRAKAAPEKDLLADLGLDDLNLASPSRPAPAPDPLAEISSSASPVETLKTPAFELDPAPAEETPAAFDEPAAIPSPLGDQAADAAVSGPAMPTADSPSDFAAPPAPTGFGDPPTADDDSGGLVGSPTMRLDSELLDALSAEPEPVEVPEPAEPASAGSAEMPPPFGQYSLLERIAVGGMAEVWKARMKGVEGFQKTVAIKKILPHLTHNEDFVTMFIDEAKLAAQLSHPNIIHIYDLGKINSHYYIAMEYVDGLNLREILNTSRDRAVPMDEGLALLIGARLASALDYAHRKRDFEGRDLGLVHRDVSPQNVLVSHDGDIKLCDFGIAKAVAKASHTQMGALKGKIQYMSPEQAWGRSVDPRSDIFSLGTLVYEMLTGQKLFSGDSEISVLEAVRECQVQPPREINPAINSDANRVLMTALAKDPEDRFQSASQLRDALEQVLYSLQPTPGPADLATYVERLRNAPETPVAAESEEPPFGLEQPPAPAPVAPSPQAPPPVVTKPPQPAAAIPEPAPRPAPPTSPPSAPSPPTTFGSEKSGDSEVASVADDFLASLGDLGKASPPAAKAEATAPTPTPTPTPTAPTPGGEAVVAPAAPIDELDLEEGGGRRRWPLVVLIALLVAGGIAAFLYFRPTDTTPPPANPESQAPETRPIEPAPTPAVDEADSDAAEDAAGEVEGSDETGAGAASIGATGTGGAAGAAATTQPSVNADAAEIAPEPEEEAAADPTQQISDLVDQELAKRERELRARLEAEQQRLQQQLEEAQRAAAEPPPTETTAPAPAPPPTTRSEPPPTEATAPPPQEEQPVATESPPRSAPPPEPVAQSPADRRPSPQPPPHAVQEAPAPKTPAPPAVRRGQLVRPGPGVVPPKLVSIQKPKYPPIARRMGVQGDVVLSVLVDENGKVIDTRLTQGIERKVGINEAALEAAGTAKYQPATKNGVEVRMWTTLRLPFRL
ncbi:MAG: TonB family protein [Acidobacteriota bacterium]